MIKGQYLTILNFNFIILIALTLFNVTKIFLNYCKPTLTISKYFFPINHNKEKIHKCDGMSSKKQIYISYKNIYNTIIIYFVTLFLSM